MSNKQRVTGGGNYFKSDDTVLNIPDTIANATDENGAIIVVDEMHAMSHKSNVFHLSDTFTIGANSSVYIAGVTQDRDLHFYSERYDATLGGLEISLYKDISLVSGTLVTPICRNQKLPLGVSSFLVYTGATITGATLANRLRIIGIPTAGTPQSRVTSSGSDLLEWELKNNSSYAIEIKNITADIITVYANFDWYEV